MKKSIKKYLILAVVIIAMLAMTFAVSAATTRTAFCDECDKDVILTQTAYGQPTCQADGYVVYGCAVHKNKIITETLNGTQLNHNLEWGYEINGNHYEYVGRCQNQISDTKCVYSEVEKNTDNTPVAYHKVTFINPFATNKTLDSCKYAVVVDRSKADAYKSVELATKYIKAGSEASYSGSVIRDKDEQFAGYKFLGWASESKLTSTAVAAANFDEIDAFKANITSNGAYVNQSLRDTLYGENGKTRIYMDDGFEVPVKDEATKADYNVYAVFDVTAVDAYSVRFYYENGIEINDYSIKLGHGDTLENSHKNKKPLKADTEGYRYTFSHWVVKNTNYEVKLTDKIYGSVDLQARFAPVPKEYVLKYFFSDGTPIKLNGEEVFDTITVAPDVDGNKKAPTNGLALVNMIPNDDNQDVYNKLFKNSTYQYEYLFTGNWIVSGTNVEFDLDNMDFSSVLDREQTNGYIKLVPKYEQRTRLYPIEVFVEYTNDGASHSTDVSLTIKTTDGVFIAGKNFTEKDIIVDAETGTKYYRYETYVPYASEYEIIATSDAYSGTKIATFYGIGFTTVKVVMERVGRDSCSCLCHSILKPIWVKVLNLLNTLFKIKVVCCDDMYANIGDLLNYTPND